MPVVIPPSGIVSPASKLNLPPEGPVATLLDVAIPSAASLSVDGRAPSVLPVPPQTPPVYPLAPADEGDRISGARGLLIGFLAGALTDGAHRGGLSGPGPLIVARALGQETFRTATVRERSSGRAPTVGASHGLRLLTRAVRTAPGETSGARHQAADRVARRAIGRRAAVEAAVLTVSDRRRFAPRSSPRPRSPPLRPPAARAPLPRAPLPRAPPPRPSAARLPAPRGALPSRRAAASRPRATTRGRTSSLRCPPGAAPRLRRPRGPARWGATTRGPWPPPDRRARAAPSPHDHARQRAPRGPPDAAQRARRGVVEAQLVAEGGGGGEIAHHSEHEGQAQGDCEERHEREVLAPARPA